MWRRRRVRARRVLGERGPYDVVLELVGAPNLPGDLEALATGGRIAVIGVGAGATAELNLLQLMVDARPDPRLHAARPAARGEGASRRAPSSARCSRSSRTGELRVPVAAEFPMADVEAAYERFAAGGKLGKIVLVAGDSSARRALGGPSGLLRRESSRRHRECMTRTLTLGGWLAESTVNGPSRRAR